MSAHEEHEALQSGSPEPGVHDGVQLDSPGGEGPHPEGHPPSRGTPHDGGPAGRLLDVRELSVSFATTSGTVRAVDGVSFALQRGEVLAIVGESGSGKSVCAMTLMGLTRGPNTTIAGSARLGGCELLEASEAQLRRIRGAHLAMVFQDPQSSLNPVHRVGNQIAEQIRAHKPLVSQAQALDRAAELMDRVGIARAHERVRSYPHELSGGMRQRVMLAMALSLGAEVVLADEPTTALDVTVQAQILAQLKELREREQLSIVLITHDFGVVADIADRIAVMQAGRIVEQGAAGEILYEPKHPYTQALLQALVPPTARRMGRPRGEPEPVVEIDDLHVSFAGRGRRVQATQALDGVSLTVGAGETLAIVGESGCGKTTLLRSIAGLVEPTSGAIRLGGQDLARASRHELASLRGVVGMVFQDPQASLNPRRRVGRTLELALRARGQKRAAAKLGVGTLLQRVGLKEEYAERFPHELSGGERQRVGIARALAGTLRGTPHDGGPPVAGEEPPMAGDTPAGDMPPAAEDTLKGAGRQAGGSRLVLLDEPVSSLDASIRLGVIELLADLQEQLGCSYVLVSHDFTTVEAIADRIAVMYAGEVVELGDARDVLERPQHPYTRELLAACPRLPGGVGSKEWADSNTPQAQDSSQTEILRSGEGNRAAPRPRSSFSA